MGYAGNTEPSYIIPSVIATNEATSGKAATRVAVQGTGAKKGVEDLDFYIGDEAVAMSSTYQNYYPIKHGQVDNWDHMERWGLCISLTFCI